MSDDLYAAIVFEKRRVRFRALAEKNRVRAAAAADTELALGYARLAIGYERLADGCEKLARQAIRHSVWEAFPFLTSGPRRLDEQSGNHPL